jgi:cell division protein FtsQ
MFGSRLAPSRPRPGDIAVPLLVGDRPARRGLWPFGSRASVTLPLHERVPARAGTVAVLLGAAAITATGLSLGGHLETFRASHGDLNHVAARIVGLGIDRVTISGIAELREREVLATAGIDPRVSLAFLDVTEARRRLEAHPLVAEASVRKLYPGEVTIQITERDPFALWQLNGEVSLISADGAIIDQLQDARFAHLPLVVGPDANKRARDYVALLAEAGPLRTRIRGATLVSGRRWTLKLDNGLDIRLPEENAAEAMARFVRLNREHNLIDKDVIAIDMRQPDRVTMRLTEEAAAARADMLKSRPKPRGGAA